MFIVSVVKLMNFKPQIACKTLFRETSPAISHELKFAFSLKKEKLLQMCQLDS